MQKWCRRKSENRNQYGVPRIPPEFHNLQADPAEKENLYDKHPDIVAELGALLKTYQTSGRSRPVRRPS